MQSKSVRKRLTVVTHVVLAFGLLAFGATVVGQSSSTPVRSSESSGRCSNRTLDGSYGFLLDGTILGSNLPLRGVVMQNYDGRGNITQVDHVVTAGGPPPQEWTPGTGSYTVNSDCTGAAVLHTVTGDVNLHFVVVNSGKQINQVVDANAVTAVGNKVN